MPMKPSKVSVFLAFLILGLVLAEGALSTFGQTYSSAELPQLQWKNYYGPFLPNDLIQTPDGGYIMAGENATFKPFEPHSPSDYVNQTGLLIKTDANGNVIWEKAYGNVLSNNFADRKLFFSIAKTNDSGYVLCGDGDWFLKVDSNGNILWDKTLGLSNIRLSHLNSTYGFDVIRNQKVIAVKDGYVLKGSVYSYSVAGYNSVLIKTDLNGNMLWYKLFLVGTETGPQNADITGLVATNDSRYIVVGDWNNQAWLAETDSDGKLLINKTYFDNPKLNGFSSCTLSKNGELVLSAYYLQGYTQGAPNYNVWLAAIDYDGNISWLKSSDAKPPFYQLNQDSNGTYVAINGLSIVRVDSNANLIWNYSVDSIGDPRSLTITKDGGYAVTGVQYYSQSNHQSIFLAKLTSSSFSTTPSPSVPEFPTWIVLPLALIATLATALIIRKKLQSFCV
jgi:hypothetical protein